ncbi:MAG: biosynthetic-type acetolactate synthase large subunit [Tissierellia bacterium]|nr:biosynthetic-type acetolactate synthase large subunit [Tissierellia bacterium]
MNGAEFLLKCLEAEGVDIVFGYPGGAVIPLFDAIFDNKNIAHFRPAHEQGGIHAADGYARVTGKPGVMIVTSGPGLTNAVTGLANAYLDSIPMVVISGQVGKGLLGKSSFQEVDTVGITMPICKHNYLVTESDEIGEAIAEAFLIATSGRPGPVVVDITKNALMEEVSDANYKAKERPIDNRLQEKYIDELDKAIELLKNAKKPVIYAGGGVLKSESSELLAELANMCNIPVANSIMGLGSFDRKSPLSFGIVGMHGDKETNLMVYESDVIVGLGVRFSDRAIGHREGFSESAKVIHIDTDPTEFNKNLDTDVAIAGSMQEILKEMINRLKDTKYKPRYYMNERDEIDKDFIPLVTLELLQNHFPDDTIIATDVGQHQMWTVRKWQFTKPRTLVTSGGLGTMGFGMGAAIGAKIGKPESPVILVTGDGSFRMNHHELIMAKDHNIPITVVVYNNSTLGMVRQWQALFNEKRYSDTDIAPNLNYEFLAMAYGINYAGEFSSRRELMEILKTLDYKNKINLLVFNLDHDMGAFPMVAAGQSINNVIEFID